MDVENAGPVITVTSSDVELSDAFRTHAQEGIEAASRKYFQNLSTAAVHVSREGTFFRCSITMQIGSLGAMTAEAQDKDAYQACTIALRKVEKQLRRTKRERREDKAVRVDKEAVLRDGLRGG